MVVVYAEGLELFDHTGLYFFNQRSLLSLSPVHHRNACNQEEGPIPALSLAKCFRGMSPCLVGIMVLSLV